MIKPTFLEPDDRPTAVGKVFGTPVVITGISWLPVLELAAWGILSRVAASKRPEWSWRKHTAAGVLSAIILFGSEWCHNLAHAALANWIGKPVDAIRIFWGTPLLIYYNINDPTVTPRQHILQAVGGPAINAVMVPVWWFIRRFTQQGSFSRYIFNFALGTNSVLSTLSLLPVPGIDGGPILKWAIVGGGHSREQADELVKLANQVVGSGLAISSGIALKKRRKWPGLALAALAATSLAIGFGLIKEQKSMNTE